MLVGCLEGKAHQANQRGDEALGLSQRQVEDRSQGQCGYDRQVGVPPLSTRTASRRRIPRANGLLVEPDRDVAAVSESDIVRRPVLHAVLRLVLRGHLGLRPGCHQRILLGYRSTMETGSTGPSAMSSQESCTNAMRSYGKRQSLLESLVPTGPESRHKNRKWCHHQFRYLRPPRNGAILLDVGRKETHVTIRSD